MHGTDIVDKGLIVLFFDLFCYFLVFFSVYHPPPSKKGLIVLFSVLFLLFFGLFSVAPSPRKFSADALVHKRGK